MLPVVGTLLFGGYAYRAAGRRIGQVTAGRPLCQALSPRWTS